MAKKKSTRVIGHYRPIRDISGLRSGKLVALSVYGVINSTTRWTCQCDCGNIVTVSLACMTKGISNSCGCATGNNISLGKLRHGMRHTREYRAWASAKSRCFNSNVKEFQSYGGRGITMCDEWRNSFEKFYADMGACPDRFTLERKNVNGNYEAANCCWISAAAQARNKRGTIFITHGGETLSLSEWSKRTGLPMSTIRSRFYRQPMAPELFGPLQPKSAKRRHYN